MMTAPAYRAHPIKNFFRNEGNRWRRHPASALLRLLCRLSVLITIFALLAIVIDLLVKGIPHLTPELFSLKYTTENQSMLPAIINTLLIALVALLVAIPIGVGGAIYLAEYAKRNSPLVRTIRLTAETLQGIPSIIYGLFGMLFFVTACGWGLSLLSGACTLAIMVLPVIMRTTEEALMAVPDSYREGGFGRTDPDPWTADPSLDAAYQSKIYRKDGPSGSDPYQYWTSNTMAYLQRSGYWGKGHLCMSSERGGANQQINMQTFYPTNIAPQPSAKAGTFGTVWGYVEALFAGTRNSENDIVADDGVQNMNIVSDTLFVVAGCYYEHDYWQEYDSSDSNQAEPDPAQKLCTMPTHQFKMALRTKSGSTGKRIQECTADELQAVGFWIETFTESPETSARAELRRLAVPVSFIEEKMGMTFFPDVPEEVKTRIPVPEEWGF